MFFSIILACSQNTPVAETTKVQLEVKESASRSFEISPDLHIPSSFVQLEHHTIDSMKERILVSIKEKRPLFYNFDPRSRSKVIADGLNLQSDDIIADIGAGTGGFELLLLEGGYSFQKVYAIDTDKGPLDFLDWMMQTAKLDGDKVELIHSKRSNISIPKESVTKAVLLNTPFYLDEKGLPATNTSTQHCMQSIVDAIKAGGELHILERHVGQKEEELHIDDAPEQHCSNLAAAFTGIGLTLKTMEMVQLAREGEPAHCRVILEKPSI